MSRWLLPFALLAAPFAGCSDDHDHDHHRGEHIDFCSLPVVCQEIVAACHAKDDATNEEIHECHETGHSVGTQEACAAVHDGCIATCNAAPSLGDAGSTFTCSDGG